MNDSIRNPLRELSRLCERHAEVLDTKECFKMDPTGGVCLQDYALERRWLARNQAKTGTVPHLSHPRTAFDLQIRRAEVACVSAATLKRTAVGNDVPVLEAITHCALATTQLRDRQADLEREVPANDTPWRQLADDAYSLGKAMNGALHRLQPPTCFNIVTDLTSQARGSFGQHEVYALAMMMEHVPDHALPCAQVQSLLRAAYQQSKKQRRPADADLTPLLSEPQQETLSAFLNHPLINAVLLDLHAHKLLEAQERQEFIVGYDLTPAAAGFKNPETRRAPTPHMQSLIVMSHREGQRQDGIFLQVRSHMDKSIKTDVESFLRCKLGQAATEQWDESLHKLATAFIAPHDYTRFMQARSLRTSLEAAHEGRALFNMRDLHTNGVHFTVPEVLLCAVKALQTAAASKQMPQRLLDRLLDLRSDIETLYQEATGHNRLALELQFILNAENQQALGTLRSRLIELTKAIDSRPMVATLRKTRSRSKLQPAAVSPNASPRGPSNEPETEPEAAPITVPATAPQLAVPTVPVMWNNKPTPLRTRLSNHAVKALIDSSMAPGTLGTPLRSAIYHYRRHVLRNLGVQPANARPLPNVTIEDYIHAAQQRFTKGWDGHTVTHARSGGNERLALVESRPKGWFTLDGRVVSYCFEDQD